MPAEFSSISSRTSEAEVSISRWRGGFYFFLLFFLSSLCSAGGWALQPFPTRRAPQRGSARLSAASSTRRGAVLGVLLLGSCSVSHPGPAALFSPVGRGRWHRRVPISAVKIAPFGSPQEERGGDERRVRAEESVCHGAGCWGGGSVQNNNQKKGKRTG